MEGTKRSLIKEHFSPELCLEIEKITLKPISNNQKGNQIADLVYKASDGTIERIGTGTNRIGLQGHGVVFKIALDKDGKIDNRREFKYSKQLQPYVIKVYECDHEGLVAVSEYVNSFSGMEQLRNNQIEIRNILSEISESYLIGDVGIDEKNSGNWGKRNDQLVMLDFAYIYAISYQTFQCSCDKKTLLKYDENFVNLVCPRCRKKYTFGQIRKRISRKQQEEEIGNIEDLGYVLSSPREEVELREDVEPALIEEREKMEKKLKKQNPYKEEIKRHREMRRRMYEDE